MNDMERRKFEDTFQEAFKDAEVNPSENVWTNIELDLEKAEGDKMKRRLLFFKTLAAASVIFALCVGGIGYYIFQYNNPSGNLATESSSKELENQNSIVKGENSSSAQEDDVQNNVTADNNKSSSATPPLKEEGSKSDPANASAKQKNSNELSDPNSTMPTIRKKSDPSTTPTQVNGNNQNLASNIREEKDPGKIADPAAANSDISDSERSRASVTARENASSGTVAKNNNDQNVNGVTPSSSGITLIEKNNLPEKSVAANEQLNERALPLFYQPSQPELLLPKSTADPGMLLLAKLADEEKAYASEQKNLERNKSEKLWTAVGFAAGGFNANNPSVSTPQGASLYSMNSANTATKQSKASGVAYSLGVSVGTKLSERWVLQGGVNYLTQSSDYTANSVIVVGENFAAPKAESLNAFAPQLADATAPTTVAQTFPYNVNNNVRFVSVPLQAGYLVINRKFGLQVNAGVSTDLFLQNTITPDGGGLTKTTQGSGSESPYRSLNFSGLMGTELSYKLGDRYRVSLNPGLRYPFNSVYKSNTGIDATPLTFDVGLRFRYIFH